jgi:hypothetical protein
MSHLEALEYTFRSNLDPDAIQARLAAASRRDWQLHQAGRATCLSTAGSPGAGSVRLDLSRADGWSYRLTTWYAAGGDRAAAAEVVWSEVLLPIDAYCVEEVPPGTTDIGRIAAHRAWSFATRLDLEAMRGALERASGRRWIERDSAWYGDYLSSITSTDDEVTKLKLFEEETRFVLDLRLGSGRPGADAAWTELVRLATEVLLPAVEARDVADDEGYD